MEDNISGKPAADYNSRQPGWKTTQLTVNKAVMQQSENHACFQEVYYYELSLAAGWIVHRSMWEMEARAELEPISTCRDGWWCPSPLMWLMFPRAVLPASRTEGGGKRKEAP